MRLIAVVTALVAAAILLATLVASSVRAESRHVDPVPHSTDAKTQALNLARWLEKYSR